MKFAVHVSWLWETKPAVLGYWECECLSYLTGFQPVSPDAKAAFTQEEQYRPGGVHVSRRREASWAKLGEHEAKITIINSLACVCTLLRGEQHKKTENTVWWEAYAIHIAHMMNWNALSPGMGCSEECEHLCVCLHEKRMQVCSWGDTVPDSGLQKSFDCPLITEIVLRSGAQTGSVFSPCLAEGRQSWRAFC